MAPFECLLLDLGHVIVDIDFHRFADRMQALTGLEVEQLRAAIMGDDLPNRYELGLLDDGAFHREICRRVRRDISWDDFVEAWNSIFVPTPLVPETLVLTLARRSPLWILSNTNGLHFEFILSHYPSLRHFTGYILSHKVGLAKPDPEIFKYALAKAGVEAGAALFVDDRAANVDAAKSLGIDAFQFVDPEQFRSELRLRRVI